MATTLDDIRKRVLDDLKRTDATRKLGTVAELDPTRLDRWIMDAVRRIQRNLRTPIDEVVKTGVIQPNFTGSIAVPGDLIELISIRVEGRELSLRNTSEIAALQRHPATQPVAYERVGAAYRIAPLPPPGTKVEIVYRSEFSKPVAPTDSLKLFNIAPDLVTTGALITAGAWANDPRRMSTSNDMYNALFMELQDLNDRTELLNAQVSPCYSFSFRRGRR